MKLNSLRYTSFCAFLVTLSLVCNSYWLEFHGGILPCPLCTLQRLIFIILTLLFALAALTANQRRELHRFWNTLSAFFSLVGGSLATRQIWLQWLPAGDKSDCGVSLQYLLKMMPLERALLRAINGSADCSQVEWTFWHLSLAEWSLGFFVVFFLVSLHQLRQTFQK